jgi:hypothetical protein
MKTIAKERPYPLKVDAPVGAIIKAMVTQRLSQEKKI